MIVALARISDSSRTTVYKYFGKHNNAPHPLHKGVGLYYNLLNHSQTSFRDEAEVFTKLSFLDITIPHPLHLKKIQKGCGLYFLKIQLFSKLNFRIE